MRNTKHKNKIILLFIFLFAIISIVTISSASTYLSPSLGNLALKQLLWYGISFILIFIIMKLKNDYIYHSAWFLYILCNLLLLC